MKVEEVVVVEPVRLESRSLRTPPDSANDENRKRKRECSVCEIGGRSKEHNKRKKRRPFSWCKILCWCAGVLSSLTSKAILPRHLRPKGEGGRDALGGTSGMSCSRSSSLALLI